MFGQLRPKPDARMLRRVAARLRVRAVRAACWSRTRWSTRRRRARIGMRTVWMQRYLGGRFRGALRDARATPAPTRRQSAFDAVPKPPYVCARIGSLRQLLRLR